MTNSHDEFEMLLSGYFDDELSEVERARLEALVAADSALRQEFEAMRSLTQGTSAVYHFLDPPDPVWDTFLDGIYNRIERATGWVVFCAGAVALAVYGAILYLWVPWANPYLKTLLALPVAGLGILFVSVLRQRLRARRTDRYSREVRW